MTGDTGYNLCTGLFIAAPIDALTVAWWTAPVCIFLALLVFAFWPVDRSGQR